MSELRIKIIVGPANSRHASLSQAVSSMAGNCELISAVRNMSELMSWADFAISAAGSTCWELAAMNVPFATVILVENQEQVAQRLKEIGVPTMGWVDADFTVRCSTILSDYVLAGMNDGWCKRLGSLIDCFGIDRILQKPANDCGMDVMASRLILRPVFEQDAELLLEWANDPVTRGNSFNSEPISIPNHFAWLESRLDNPHVRMFILELDGRPSGHIRYEMNEKDDAILSFVVSPVFRGMGIGEKLIELSRPKIAETWTGCLIKALTLRENRASARIFEKTGFTKLETEPVCGKACNLFCWSDGENGR